MPDLYPLAGPLLRLLDPECAHDLALAALERGLVPRPAPFEDAILQTRVLNRDFANPIGLAAGFDKDARVADAMLAQGFGFVEIGSVTPLPQPGNPRPRVFRLAADGAAVNRLGFNSQGVEAVAERLGKRKRAGIVGVNIGRNKDTAQAVDDYVAATHVLARLADYLVLNVSSPNTPGLRALQDGDELRRLVFGVQEALADVAKHERPPLLLKIAPDLMDEDKDDIAAVSLEAGIDGLIATNTTIERPSTLVGRHRNEAGGLSGRPLFEPSTRVLSEMYRRIGHRIPLIGVGGISDGHDAYAKIRAGASLVQIYTALIYHGPGLVNRIKRELAALLRADGFASLSEAVGTGQR
ncbi:MAG: quinone-dependent dihydroorotate dehydrogenase [Rhodospirillales bacterium]|jgi:dihydroorotate dehydrogenase|nr:quinone-dependent dihydroorotate dehydrogenase [Rhodospirillales bacterium]